MGCGFIAKETHPANGRLGRQRAGRYHEAHPIYHVRGVGPALNFRNSFKKRRSFLFDDDAAQAWHSKVWLTGALRAAPHGARKKRNPEKDHPLNRPPPTYRTITTRPFITGRSISATPLPGPRLGRGGPQLWWPHFLDFICFPEQTIKQTHKQTKKTHNPS